ncbi:MAG: ATP-binding cassette domain-containing protein [Desulfobacula sp.]|uniref:ABC transporter ATP-binding protein n=1 Tax=Desulfobacula sp. TaxID=2593537 RepID=UPI0025BF8D72|nr:oligopeptide/dipeptide ABC transporter ATP-binding protein [Desulfobacula sp.]MCD4718817.1 ATP-binding cassette domain-containing protein [Desulfobacula sp.]
MKSLIEVDNLKVHFPIGRPRLFGKKQQLLKAVDGISFKIKVGETLGLVGESGSGKTTLGRAVLRLIEPTAGEISVQFNGEAVNLTDLNQKELRHHWRNMQMIFQDPYSSLNPRMTVKEIIGESLLANKLASGKELEEKVVYIADLCNLNVQQLGRYPHAFSGGQRQRIAIARALVMRPQFIVADEPVSSLDVSIQAQILNLLKDLQKELGLTYLFIGHDLNTVAYACDRVAVMYLGQIVELASTERLYNTPKHPYTEALMSAIPSLDPEESMQNVLLEGEQPNPADPPTGCYFHPRCRYADKDKCLSQKPPFCEMSDDWFVACHFADKLKLKGALDYS